MHSTILKPHGDGRGEGAATTVGHKIFAGVYFCGLAIFCVLQEIIFGIRTELIFLAGN